MASYSDRLVAVRIRPKHLVEQLSEPALEDIDLFGGDRNVVRPVIDDTPVRKVIRSWTSTRLRVGRFAVVVEIDTAHRLGCSVSVASFA